MLLHRIAGKKEGADIQAETTCPEAQEPPRPYGGLKLYWKNKNARSIDGLPGLAVAHASLTRFEESKQYPKDDIHIASVNVNVKEPVFDTRSAVWFLLGILVSVAFVQLRTSLAPLLKL